VNVGRGPWRADVIAAAVALDDPYPANICPGCACRIDGGPDRSWTWAQFGLHARGGSEWRDSGYHAAHELLAGKLVMASWVCPWTYEFLTARAYRKQIIRDSLLTL
jgi:hypothetical protein